MLIPILLFAAGTVVNVAVSRRTLEHPRSHGFYRFFVFEGALVLVLLNGHAWFTDPFSSRQLVSWCLLVVSAVLPILGVHQLRAAGGAREQQSPGPEYRFERTSELVTGGVYRLIRHPMYASLFYFAWGAMLKDVSWPALAVALVTTVFVYLTARVEERELTERFGDSYRAYMKKTRMFIPYIW